MSIQRAPAIRVQSPDSDTRSGATSPSKSAAHRTRTKPHWLFQWLLLLAATALVAFFTSTRLLEGGVRQEQPIKPHLDAPPINATQHIASERMLRMLVEECSKGEDSVIWVDPEGSMVVQSEVDTQQCPIMDVMLKGPQRGIGMCTDAMLYVLHLGARLLGAVGDMRQYEAACGPATARLFLEEMYPEFMSSQPGVLHMQLMNAEHMFVRDAELHKKLDAFLCKTEMCRDLLQRHVKRKGWRGGVWLMGHTSGDPTVDLPPDAHSQQRVTFLHIKGKSGLKHTQQLLECWRSRPDLPQLTVVGRFTFGEVNASLAAPNILIYPKVTEAFNDTQTAHISFSTLRSLQVQQPIHFCPSEREGFGHYINEARAAGAFIISTDHPPMNELVTPAIGLLIKPSHTSSWDLMALRRYMDINADVNASQLCAAADEALRIPLKELQKRGQLGRQAYLHSNAVFLARIRDLQLYLERHAEAMDVTSAPRADQWRKQLRQQPGATRWRL